MDHPSLARQLGVLSTAGQRFSRHFVKSVNLAVVSDVQSLAYVSLFGPVRA
jgi:hypothetical protein